MKLEGIILNEIRLSQKDKYFMIPVCEVPRVVEFIEMASRWWLLRAGKTQEWGIIV